MKKALCKLLWAIVDLGIVAFILGAFIVPFVHPHLFWIAIIAIVLFVAYGKDLYEWASKNKPIE